MSTTTKVWSRFTKNRNGKELKLRIQELTEDQYEHIFDILFKYFIPDEPLHKASKIAQRAEVLEEYKQVFAGISKETNYQIDACCLDDDSDNLQIVGLSIMLLEKRGEHAENLETIKKMVQSEEIKTLLELSTLMDNKYNIFEKYNVATCYKGRGVVVHEDYRGLGIAGEILKMRSIVCKERRVPITSAWMTSTGTQKAAARLGWDTIHELVYKDFGKDTGVEFEGGPETCKLMVIEP